MTEQLLGRAETLHLKQYGQGYFVRIGVSPITMLDTDSQIGEVSIVEAGEKHCRRYGILCYLL